MKHLFLVHAYSPPNLLGYFSLKQQKDGSYFLQEFGVIESEFSFDRGRRFAEETIPVAINQRCSNLNSDSPSVDLQLPLPLGPFFENSHRFETFKDIAFMGQVMEAGRSETSLINFQRDPGRHVFWDTDGF